MTMSDVKTALAGTGLKFRHFAWSKAPSGDYGVYGEDMGRELRAGNLVIEQELQGTIDYFTRDDSDLPRTTIQTALTTAGINFSLDSIQYESDTGYIHYSWVFYING